MDQEPSSWVDYLNNKLALKTMFSGQTPALDNLLLARLVIGQGGAVYVSLNLPSLPTGSPNRWIARGCDSVQLRLTFYYLAEISIAGAYEEGNLDVNVSFQPDRRFLISNPKFKVELAYEQVRAVMYPYDSSIFEEPLPWRHE